MATKKKPKKPPINFITINVRRAVGDKITDAAQERELAYMRKIADLFGVESDVIIKVHDCCGVYLYSPLGDT
jgi:hypothetical protein